MSRRRSISLRAAVTARGSCSSGSMMCMIPGRLTKRSCSRCAARAMTLMRSDLFAVLVAMDAQIGRLVNALRASGELDNTLVVLTGDNGPSGSPQYYENGATPPGDASIFRGRKGSLYEGGLREPLIVHWPQRHRARETGCDDHRKWRRSVSDAGAARWRENSRYAGRSQSRRCMDRTAARVPTGSLLRLRRFRGPRQIAAPVS